MNEWVSEPMPLTIFKKNQDWIDQMEKVGFPRLTPTAWLWPTRTLPHEIIPSITMRGDLLNNSHVVIKLFGIVIKERGGH